LHGRFDQHAPPLPFPFTPPILTHFVLSCLIGFAAQFAAQKEAEEEGKANGTSSSTEAAAAAAAAGEAAANGGVDAEGKAVSSDTMASMLAVDSKRACTAALRAQVRGQAGSARVL
jgi:hypothetical protein